MTTRNRNFGSKGWTPQRLGPLTGKTYVITGANAGAGFEATRVFLSKGAKVVMMNRNAEKLKVAIETLKQEFGSDANATFVRMDLAVLDSVRETAGKVVQVQVCHPGASRTELSEDEASLSTKILFTLLSPLVQSAEKGSWPEVPCATEEGLKSQTFHGPTKRAEMVGPIDECPLEDHVLNREMVAKLWTLSEQKTSLSRSL